MTAFRAFSGPEARSTYKLMYVPEAFPPAIARHEWAAE